MYSSDEKSTAIAYRCINDNLPRFLDNVKSFQKVFDNLSDETITKLNTDLYNTFGRNIEDIFLLIILNLFWLNRVLIFIIL